MRMDEDEDEDEDVDDAHVGSIWGSILGRFCKRSGACTKTCGGDTKGGLGIILGIQNTPKVVQDGIWRT